MADAYQLETSTDRYLLEDGSGVYLLEDVVGADAAYVGGGYYPSPFAALRRLWRGALRRLIFEM